MSELGFLRLVGWWD